MLELARRDGSVLVTRNTADIPRILRDWLEAGHSHAGVILVHGVGPAQHELVAGGVERWLRQRPRQEDWIDVCAFAGREARTPD